MKKSIAILLCAILLVSLFSACSAKPAEVEQPEAATTPAAESQPQQEQAEEPAAASTEKTVITFWNGFTGTDGDVLKEIVAEYNATNTLNVEIQVEIMSWDSLYQKLATALPVGEGPDIIAYNTEYIASYAESGALAVINDLYETGGMDAKAIPAAMEENLKYNTMVSRATWQHCCCITTRICSLRQDLTPKRLPRPGTNWSLRLWP